MAMCYHCKAEFEPIYENQVERFCPTCVEIGIPEDWAVAQSYHKEGYSWRQSLVFAGLADPPEDRS